MLNGYKTYTGILITIFGITGVAKYISPDQTNLVIDNIVHIVNLTLETVGIVMTVVGAIHKDMRLKQPV
jgi:energy-converting hydrogenase Eha subunit E